VINPKCQNSVIPHTSIDYGSVIKVKNGDEAKVVPIVYGTQRVPGTQIGTGAVYPKGSNPANYNSTQVSANQMAASPWYVICMGKIAVLDMLYDGKSSINYNVSYLNDGTGAYYPILYHSGGTTVLEGLSKISGVAHYYDQHSYTKFNDTYPKTEFIVRKILSTGFAAAYYASIGQSVPAGADDDCKLGGTSYGNNPASVIYDLLTNIQYGLGISTSQINLKSFYDTWFIYYTKGYGLSFTIDKPISLQRVIQDIQDWTGISLSTDNDGKFYLSAGNADSLGIIKGSLSTDDFIDYSITRRSWEDTFNEFRAKYIDSTLQYTERELCLKDEANYVSTGSFRAKTFDLSGFINASIASARLFEIMKMDSFPFINIECELGMELITCLINDVYYIVNTENNLAGYFRVSSKKIAEWNSSRLTIKFEQVPSDLFDSNSSTVSNPEGVDNSGDPGTPINLTFPAGTDTSSVRATPFSDDTLSIVTWGSGQEQKGLLVYTTDYTVIDHNKIKLTSLWTNSIQANALGLLNIDTWQG
jgi:hypothetical protein